MLLFLEQKKKRETKGGEVEFPPLSSNSHNKRKFPPAVHFASRAADWKVDDSLLAALPRILWIFKVILGHETKTFLLVHSRMVFFKLFRSHFQFHSSSTEFFFLFLMSTIAVRVLVLGLLFKLAFARSNFFQFSPSLRPLSVFVKHGQLRVFITSSVWLSVHKLFYSSCANLHENAFVSPPLVWSRRREIKQQWTRLWFIGAFTAWLTITFDRFFLPKKRGSIILFLLAHTWSLKLQRLEPKQSARRRRLVQNKKSDIDCCIVSWLTRGPHNESERCDDFLIDEAFDYSSRRCSSRIQKFFHPESMSGQKISISISSDKRFTLREIEQTAWC